MKHPVLSAFMWRLVLHIFTVERKHGGIFLVNSLCLSWCKCFDSQSPIHCSFFNSSKIYFLSPSLHMFHPWKDNYMHNIYSFVFIQVSERNWNPCHVPRTSFERFAHFSFDWKIWDSNDVWFIIPATYFTDIWDPTL